MVSAAAVWVVYGSQELLKGGCLGTIVTNDLVTTLLDLMMVYADMVEATGDQMIRERVVMNRRNYMAGEEDRGCLSETY